jgi:hypothetical protein
MTMNSANAATIAPTAWPIQYSTASRVLIRPEDRSPTVTAGLMWQPETGPMAYAMARSDRPKANATPSGPITFPAMTAEPTPPNTRTNVPTASAMPRLYVMPPPFRCRTDVRRLPDRRPRGQPAQGSWRGRVSGR